MIIKLLNQIFLQTEKQKKYFLLVFLFLIFSYSIFGQTVIGDFTFTEIPKDKQLYARNTNDKGTVLIEGQFDRSGSSPEYDRVQIRVKRGSTSYATPFENLVYSGDIATFNFNIEFDAEMENYSFEIRAREGGSFTQIALIKDVVAGDVYIVQGQSNAVASQKDNSDSANGNIDSFIRVYANATELESDLIANNEWYIADGDGGRNEDGNAGQWGLTLAKLIVDRENVPVAIFNGARGAKRISYFQENHVQVKPAISTNNNYERLLYRLDTTRLKNAVKAVFWSQGENVGGISSVNDYKNEFSSLRSSWLNDYPNIERFYIFQTRNGCGTPIDNIMLNKEAQRQLAFENEDIHIMSTEALTQFFDNVHTDTQDYDYCHFVYTNGYEGFATRIYDLVQRDFYGGGAGEIHPPNIIDAYLTNDTTLIVETDASSLSVGTINDNFELTNARSASINTISVSGNKVVFTLSKYPGPNAKLSYLGADPGVHDNLITSVNGLELLSFLEYSITDKPAESIWDGNSWSPNEPDSTMDAIIDGDYNASDGNIVSNSLTINSGVALNFDNGTTNSAIVYGNLTIDGTFTIGDQESLVMYDKNATITGVITKNESSTSRNNLHDFTYWSSSITDAKIQDVFPGVTPSRIFYYDQSLSSETDDTKPEYWYVWVNAPQNMTMTPGQGFASEGDSAGVHDISFTGEPNNGDITINIVRQNPGNDYNLIGNPYPSAISISEFFSINPNVDVAYLWTHNTPITGGDSGDYTADDYASINKSGGTSTCSGCATPSDNIGSGQGFFVNATGSGSVTFTNDMRLFDANDQFFKSNNTKNTARNNHIESKDRVWLDLSTDQGGFNQILIGFQKKLTNGVDEGYDALKFKGSSNPISFYSVIEDKKYAIQGQRTFISLRKVKLGFDTKIAPRTFTIRIAKTEGVLDEANVYLVDKELHITHDLRVSDYKFVQNITGEFRDRFLLKFENNSSTDIEVEDKNSFTVHNAYNGYTAVKANNKIISIKVYDIYGNLLIQAKPNRYKFVLNTSQIKLGTILLIEASFENGEIVRKKTIKY